MRITFKMKVMHSHALIIYSNTVVIYVGANIDTIKRRLEVRGSAPEEIMERVNKEIIALR